MQQARDRKLRTTQVLGALLHDDGRGGGRLGCCTYSLIGLWMIKLLREKNLKGIFGASLQNKQKKMQTGVLVNFLGDMNF